MLATWVKTLYRFKQAKQQLCTCIRLSLHDYNVKVPNFTFCRRRKLRQWLSFSFPELWYCLLEFNSWRICLHLTNYSKWNKRKNVWRSTNALFKWRFRTRRRRCCLSSLFLEIHSSTPFLPPTGWGRGANPTSHPSYLHSCRSERQKEVGKEGNFTEE